MVSKRVSSERRRSRPVTKQKPTNKLKKNKFAMAMVILIIFMLVFSTFYVVFNTFGGPNTNTSTGYKSDQAYIDAIAGTDNPVAVIELSEEEAIAVELYIEDMPITCQNFIRIAQNGYYDNMIVHRVQEEFMMQMGKIYSDESKSDFVSPFGQIIFENSDVTHVDGAISMASTGAGVGGSAEFFICSGDQNYLNGNYAAFGKTIYGLNKVKEIAAVGHDGSYGAVGGGRPLEDIVINSIKIVNL
jgi:cyclophilin family peptidyl-prolyl cis-trans isomerase